MAPLVPTEPEAPGWLTMTIFWPSEVSSSPAAIRVTWSVEPPAPQGTMTVIGFVGFQPVPAGAGSLAPSADAKEIAARAKTANNARFMFNTS